MSIALDMDEHIHLAITVGLRIIPHPPTTRVGVGARRHKYCSCNRELNDAVPVYQGQMTFRTNDKWQYLCCFTKI